jgi:ubiquinone/menaquinone biosynthesis C-methylase UbiE
VTGAAAEVTKQQRAGSFGAVADDYERSRPGYPLEAVRWLAGSSPVLVLDVAAGTGKLTRQLRAFGHRVVGLEPSVQMLNRLHLAGKEIPVVAARAEALPFRPATFDAVTVAQAWHWFDRTAATAELARVLRPGGHAGILWNFRDESVDWVAELSTLIGSEGTSEAESDSDPLAGAAFSASIKRTFWFQQALDRDLLVALVRSRSYVATLPEDEQAALLARIVKLCEEHPQLARRSRFVMPYRTLAFRAQQLG